MTTWLTSFIEQFGYFAILLLIAVENIFPPIPSEVILTLGGFLVHITNLKLLGVIIFSTLGSLLGAIILFALSRNLTLSRLEKLLSTKLFKILGFKKDDAQKAINWFDKHGIGAIFYGRCIPVVRSLISIPAGIARVSWAKFLVLTTLGSLIWNSVLIYLGFHMGKNWQVIVKIFDDYTLIIIGLLIILFICFGIKWYKNRIKAKN
ncbi:DedA family protein [Lactobacillus hominis]|uniref:Alkaline phosphatase-like protein n=1 Tax=Lactobacillus hominis DSM 23910 = CRBIP 24.179 TaxID=1423758 RepID=I7L5P5_9LACO|nr:DedA family protein [Lactobacillus hominis]KRM85919.1 alkaline phosphatase [Lactobacillus hominis DSM 23910 = CRBIP 24.179]MCT3348846.1 DedA family protein [Lactobacillus hominis]CCI81527.1 Alkaline phosphatase-like protein [Lactobacillus hominis DSM 23910 = CRBIP 24.179]